MTTEVLIRSAGRGDGKVHTVAHVGLDENGRVNISADRLSEIEFLTDYGCFEGGERIYEWTDGEPWVRALPWNLHGTYVWAEAVPPISAL